MKERSDSPARYQGKNLLSLLLAFGVPVLVLYLGRVLAIAAEQGTTPAPQRWWLNRASYLMLVGFVPVQLFGARKIDLLLTLRHSVAGRIFQYAVVFICCSFLSISAATACEAFGYVLFLHVNGRIR